MKAHLAVLFLIAVVCGCNKMPPTRSTALPDNVVSDKPIILKEGQAVILMREGDRALMIAASVIDEELSIGEIDPKGRSFGVTWKDADTWDTSTTVTDGNNRTLVLDKNGDGYADFRAEMTPSGDRGYELQGETWVEFKRNNKKSEQDAPSNR